MNFKKTGTIIFVSVFLFCNICFASDFDKPFVSNIWENIYNFYENKDKGFLCSGELSFSAIELVSSSFFFQTLKEFPDVSNLTFTGLLGNLRKKYNGISNLLGVDFRFGWHQDNFKYFFKTQAGLINKKSKEKSISGLFDKEINHIYTHICPSLCLETSNRLFRKKNVDLVMLLEVDLFVDFISQGITITNDYDKFKDDLKHYIENYFQKHFIYF